MSSLITDTPRLLPRSSEPEGAQRRSNLVLWIYYEPHWIRTSDPRLKRALLYLLS